MGVNYNTCTLICHVILVNACFGMDDLECEALKDFYYSTNGDNWHNNKGWPFAANNNFTCDDICGATTPFGLQCETDTSNSTQHVTSLGFDQGNHLYGTIPTSIKHLKYLKKIQIGFGNHIYGTIPTNSISTMTNLKYLDLDVETHFSNQTDTTMRSYFPLNDTLCQLTNLSYIDICADNLQGDIPNCLSNLTSLTYLSLSQNSHLNINTGISNNYKRSIPSSLFQMAKLEQLYLKNIMLEGTLPDNINAPMLSSLDVSNNYLRGTIPESICANIAADDISFDFSRNKFTGALPVCIFQVDNVGMWSEFVEFDFSQNKITSIPYLNDTQISQLRCQEFFNKSILFSLYLALNEIKGPLPQWLALCEFSDIDLSYNYLTGTIPNKWHIGESFDLSNNFFEGSVPNDLIASFDSNNFVSIISVDLSNNKFFGTFPTTFATNTCVSVLSLQNNKFEYFPFDEISHTCLEIVQLDNNDLKQANIGDKINHFLMNNQNLQVLSLHNNANIKGSIRKLFDNQTFIDKTNINFSALTLHNCDVSGKMPNSLNLMTLQTFTLYNNRLSCDISDHNMVTYNDSTILLLLGNLFNFHTEKHGWLSELSPVSQYFIQATSLYLTDEQIVVLFVMIVFTLVCFVAMTVYKSVVYLKRPMIAVSNKNHETRFLISISVIYKFISNIFVIIIAVALIVIYYFTSNYYECGRITSHLSIAYVEISKEYLSETESLVCQILICILVIFFNLIVVNQLSKLIFALIFGELSTSKGKLSDSFGSSVSSASGYTKWNCNCTVKLTIKAFIWLSLYLVCAMLSIFYVLTMQLPDDNVFNINTEWERLLFHYLLAFILTATNVFVVPTLTDSMTNICGLQLNKHSYKRLRPYIIMTLRSLIAIFIPFGASIVLLNNCLGYWTYFWDPCRNKSLGSSLFDKTAYFDTETQINAINAGSAGAGSVYLQLSSRDDICSHGWTDVTTCFRSYFDIWIPIVIIKLSLFILNPWYVIKYILFLFKVNLCQVQFAQ